MGVLDWRNIEYFAVVYYSLVLLSLILIHVFTREFRFRKISILLLVLSVLKIAAALCCIELVNNNPTSISLYIASMVLNNIAVGLFIRSITSILDDHSQSYPTKSLFGSVRNIIIDSSTDLLEKFDSLTNLIILAAVILSAVGGGLAYEDRTTARKLLEAGSVLYLASIVLIGLSIVWRFQSIDRPKALLLLSIIPFMLIRTVYSVCSAFLFNGYIGDSVSRFDFLFGDYRRYLGMVVMEESVVVAVLLGLVNLIVREQKMLL